MGNVDIVNVIHTDYIINNFRSIKLMTPSVNIGLTFHKQFVP